MIMSPSETISTLFDSPKETLVRYVEVWTPNEDATRLTLVATQVTGPITRKKPKHKVVSVAKGAGLAGTAWQQKAVSIVHRDDVGQLDRINVRSDHDLTAVLAIPVFFQQEIRGVVVIGLGDGFGAAEIWTRDDRDELAVSASHYAGLESFEFITRYTRFPKGAGVPGRVWQSGLPYLLQKLGHSDSFIRSFGNDEAEIGAAIGLPIGHERGFPASVLLLLSSTATPIASLTELWECEQSAVVDAGMPVARLIGVTRIAGGSVSVGSGSSPEAWQFELLQKTESAGQPLLVTAEEAELPTGAKFNLSIPLFKNDVLRNVLNLMF